MNWFVVIALASGNMALKVAGVMLFTRRPMPQWLQGSVSALPLAIYPALVASATFGSGRGPHLDGRVISAAAVVVLLLVFRNKNLFGVAILLGALVTAVIRYLAVHGYR